MQVLDKGFVELIDHMGSDLSVVNGVRISMGKRKEVFDYKDAGLINYLLIMSSPLTKLCSSFCAALVLASLLNDSMSVSSLKFLSLAKLKT